MLKKEYVEFYFPGISCSGQKEREVSSREIELAGLIPEGAISYRFFGKNSNGNKVDYSPYYYIGREYNIEEFKEKYPQLRNDPEFCEVKRIVRAITGAFYPLTETDIVVSD